MREDMALVSISGLINGSIKASGKMVTCMVMVYLSLKRMLSLKLFKNMESD